MTDTERIRKLAEWLGWKFRVVKGIPWIIRIGGDYVENWNPLTHIQDAWMLEEKAFEDGLGGNYMRNLLWIVAHARSIGDLTLVGLYYVIHATPDQRCQAIEKLIEAKPC